MTNLCSLYGLWSLEKHLDVLYEGKIFHFIYFWRLDLLFYTTKTGNYNNKVSQSYEYLQETIQEIQALLSLFIEVYYIYALC